MDRSKSPTLRRDGVVIALFLALTAVMTNPLVLHLADAVEDKQDGLLNTWIIAWVGHALITDPLHLFDTNIFYPFTKTLALSEVLLPQGLLALPINLASDNTVLGNNLVLFFSLFLSAYSMYLLVWDLTRVKSAAFVAGTVFAFNPYNLGNLAQVQLLSFGWMPLALLFLARVMRKSKKTSMRWALKMCLLFALFFSLQALSSIYYAFLAALAIVICTLWAMFSHFSLSSLTTLSARFAISGIIIAILVVPFLLPYIDIQRELGLSRKIQESEPFSASLQLYTEVSSQNVLYGGILAPQPPISNGCYPLDNLFPGFVALGLGLVGLTSQRRVKWLGLIILGLAFLLSLGPRLYLSPTLATDISLPYRWLYDLIPLMGAFRAPVRFDALVMLALAVLAGFGVERLLVAGRLARSRQSWVVVALGLLVSLEYFAFPAANTVSVPNGDAIPQYVRWLARQQQGIALELPMIQPACPLDLTSQYLSTYHWQKTPDGYSGFALGERGTVAYEMESFPGERAVSLLQALGANYVVVHGDKLSLASAVEEKMHDLELVQRFGSDLIYRVIPHPWDAITFATGLKASTYLPQPAAPGQMYTAFLILRNEAGRSYAIKPGQKLDVGWQYNPVPSDPSRFQAGETTVALPLVTSIVTVVPVHIPAPSQPGDFRLLMSVRNSDFSFWNLGGDLRVASEEAAAEIVLPAAVSLAHPLQSSYSPGNRLLVQLNWHALNKIDAYYSASIRVVDSQGNKVASQDREPAGQTMLWRPGSTIPDQFELTLPNDLARGGYSVQVLMYQANSGVDALLLGQDATPQKSTELARFDVK